MTRFCLQDVLDSTGAVLVRGDARLDISGISTDTRTIDSGDLFFALSGPNFDGNRFADEAVRAGAAAVLLRDGDEVRDRRFAGDAPVVVHPDPRRALADLAA